MSTKFVVIAIGLVIGLALVPVVSQQVRQVSGPPTCTGSLSPVRIPGTVTGTGGGGLTAAIANAQGGVVCRASASDQTLGLKTTDMQVTFRGGQLNALYAGPAPGGILVSAGSLVNLIPLAFIAALVIGPVGIYAYTKRYGGGM